MTALLKQLEQIFETAQQGAGEDCGWSILVQRNGAIHMVAGSEWELEPLRRHHGAKAAYRVTRRGDAIQLEARSDKGACRLQSAPPVPLPALCLDFPRYQLM